MLPDLSALTSLQTLNLGFCQSLTALPDFSTLTSLQTLNLFRCESLTALPDLSALTSLQTLNLNTPHVAARSVGAHVAQTDLCECSPSTYCPICRPQGERPP